MKALALALALFVTSACSSVAQAPTSIPTLAPLARLPRGWSSVPNPVPVMRRATLALAVARLAGAGTWGDAGDALGIDAQYAPRVVRHTLSQIGGTAPQDLTSAALTYASWLRAHGHDQARPLGTPLRRAVDLAGFSKVVD